MLATVAPRGEADTLLQTAWARIRKVRGEDAAAALGFIIEFLDVLPPSAQSDVRMLVLIQVDDLAQQRMLWGGIDVLQRN